MSTPPTTPSPSLEGGTALEHWIWGSVPDRGYSVRAQSAGLNLGFYAPRLEGHYTPIRGDTVEANGPNVDLVMIHPASSGTELLYSVIGPGPDDDRGRMTFANHTAVLPVRALRDGSLRFEGVDTAIRAFDRDHPEPIDSLPVLSVPRPPDGPGLGQEIGRFVTRAAAETLLSRLLTAPESRTLLLARETPPADRRRALTQLTEALHLVCDLPFVTSISDGPTAAQLNRFQLVVAPRGLRADNTWAILDSTLDAPTLPRVEDEGPRYDRLLACFGPAP
jgi:hypothetical protein